MGERVRVVLYCTEGKDARGIGTAQQKACQIDETLVRLERKGDAKEMQRNERK